MVKLCINLAKNSTYMKKTPNITVNKLSFLLILQTVMPFSGTVSSHTIKMTKATIKYLMILILLICGVNTAYCRTTNKAAEKSISANKPFVVVIDAGHGGKDPGCVGKTANEKTITLSVAKALGERIKQRHPDVSIVYTRNDDRYLTLQQRADIANRNKGNLFISVHVNSLDYDVPGREKTAGASVYTVGVEKENNTLGVAMRENAVMELEDDYTARYSGFDPKSAESYIIFELNNDMHLRQSIRFANMCQYELVNTAQRNDKKVRQAGFWVLWATSMPSVLVELDFICNPETEKFLASEHGVGKCSDALFNAFSKYYVAYMAGQKKL